MPACETKLDAYENQLMAFEAERFGKSFSRSDWEDIAGLRELLGREVTDEVIEYDASLPGYKGRRVVQFRRLDTRESEGFDAPSSRPEGNEGTCSTSVAIAGRGITF